MDNAAVRTVHAVQGDAEFGGIRFHLLDLCRSQYVRNWHIEWGCGNGMIHRRKGLLGAPDLEPTLPQAGEGLR